jgi:large subunit ribosomal protein L10
MSKPVKNLIVDSYKRRFADMDGAVVISLRGVGSNLNNSLRGALAEKQMRITVVKNSLARRALEGTDVAGLSQIMDGPSALVYGGESVVDIARALVEQAKTVANLEFRGALMEGQAFGPDQIDELSKYPTRPEAQGQVIQLVLSPAQNLMGAVTGPGRKIVSLVKAIEEKLEKGEAITKAA